MTIAGFSLGCMARRPLFAFAVIVVALAAVWRYTARDYRPAFARSAGALIQVRDSTEVGLATGGERLTEVTLRSDTGLEARLRVRAPDEPGNVRHPAILLVGGIRTGRRAVDLPSETGGFVVAGLDYPYDGPVWPTGVGWARHLPALRGALLEMPAAMLLAAQYLYSREDVDPDRVTVVGVSFGAPFATAVAATDRRLAGAALLHGGADIEAMAKTAFGARLGGVQGALVARATALLLAPLEPARYAGGIAPRPTLVVAAQSDERIDRHSAEALIDAVREPRRVVWSDTEHVSSDRKSSVEQLFALTVDWMRLQGLGPETP